MKRFLIIFIAAVLILGIGSAAFAKIIRVNQASTTNGPGDTWTNGYRTVTAALAAAVSGDEVWVKHGYYYESITIPSGVALYGSFAGTETSPSQRILYPMLGFSDNQSELVGVGLYNKRLVYIPASATSGTRLDGFSVYNCDSGGISVGASSSPVITNCVIGRCSAYAGGGVSVSTNATPLITNNYIQGCEATTGAGIYVNGGQPTIIGNTFNDNTVSCGDFESTTEGCGGAIYMANTGAGTILIANNKMWKNLAYNKGGAIMCDYSNPVIVGNVMYVNSASHTWEGVVYGTGSGGGIYCGHANAVINQNSFAWCGAKYHGGAICFDTLSTATIQGNIFYEGIITGYGPHICNFGDSAAVQADYNDSYGWGDGAYYRVTKGPHEINVDPMLVNSGTEMTDLHLRSGSPCVDTGCPSITGLQSKDSDGNPRVVGPTIDKGGYEYQTGITALANDTPVSQTAATSLYWFQVQNAKWAAVGVASQTSADLQASTSVWLTNPYATSVYSGTVRDFIVANGGSYGNSSHYAQVYGNSGTSTVEAEWDAKAIGPGIPESGSFTATDVLDVYQASLLTGKTYQIVVHPTSGTPDISLFVFRPSQTGGSRLTADWSSCSGGAGADEQVYAITAETGNYGIVVVNEAGTAGTYNLSITEKAPITISGRVTNFAGTGMSRIVVRADNGGSSEATDLSGNYTLTVPYYWSGNVSAGRSGWAFSPASRMYKAPLTSNVTGANFTGGQVTTVGGTKSLPDGRAVYLADKPVTAVFGSDAYIEDADHTGGILVVGGATTSKSVTVGGVLGTSNGERRITLPVTINTGTSTVTPLYLINKAIGGATKTYAPGIPGTTGVNNVGLLVKTSGVVTGVSGNIFYVNDGSGVVDVPGTLGVRVDTGGAFSAPAVGKQVIITGISSVWMNGSTPVRQLKPRNADDIQRIYKIALIQGANTTGAAEIHNLVETCLMDMTLIPDSQVTATDFSSFDAVMISSDSLLYQNSQAIAKVTNSGLPVMGMGSGGSRYFKARGLYIDWSHSMTTSGPSTIVPKEAASDIFHSPNEVWSTTITPYAYNVSAVLVYMPNSVSGVTRLASSPAPADSYYVLCSQSRCLLWGYEAGAHQLTGSGKDLFINAVYYTLGL